MGDDENRIVDLSAARNIDSIPFEKMSKTLEIECPNCKMDALLRKEPVYEGFRKTGERLFCSACGHVFENEQTVPFKKKREPSLFGPEDRQARPQLFSDADKPAAVKVFADSENKRLCRYCEHYVINPFVQRCALHRKEVEATDTCCSFSERPAEPESR